MPDYRLARKLIPREEIHGMVKRVASDIYRDYMDTGPPLMVGLLKGAVPFCIGLRRCLNSMGMYPELKLVKASSYGASGTVSSGEVRVEGDLSGVRGREVLLVDDIIDTGRTPRRMISLLDGMGASEIRTCFLLSKPERRAVDVPDDYLGAEIPDEFVVGFGLDCAERFRYKKDIWTVEELPQTPTSRLY